MAAHDTLRVHWPSGKEVLAISLEEQIDVKTLKQRLQSACGRPRFSQRLLCAGSILEDDTNLDSPVDAQLILLPYTRVCRADTLRLITRSANGRAREVEELLQRPQNPRACDKRGRSPLIAASERGHVDIARLLLEAAAGIDIAETRCGGYTAIDCAAAKGHVDLVRLLLEFEPANVSLDMTCCEQEDEEEEEEEEEGKAEVEEESSDSDFTGNECDEYGAPGLIVAATRGHTEIVRLLLETQTKQYLWKTEDLDRALPVVCKQGHVDIARLLLQHQAFPDMADDGVPALFLAASHQHVDVVCLLLEAWANPNMCCDGDLNSALHVACRVRPHQNLVKSIDIARALLQSGADRNLLNVAMPSLSIVLLLSQS